MFCALFACAAMFVLTSCGGTESKVVDAYHDAQAKMEKASSNDEVDEINDELIDAIATILRENPNDVSAISTSADVKKAYKEYWDAVEKTDNGDHHYMFVSMPQVKYIEKKL